MKDNHPTPVESIRVKARHIFAFLLCMQPDYAAERALVAQPRGAGLEIHEWIEPTPELEITRRGVFEGLSA